MDGSLTEEQKDAIAQVQNWLAADAWQLERNDCSRLHKLADAYRSGEVLYLSDGGEPSIIEKLVTSPMAGHVFIIQHDWPRILGEVVQTAWDNREDVPQPYEACIFELRINGRVLLIEQTELEDRKTEWRTVVQIGTHWVEYERLTATCRYAQKAIYASLIAVDADVAHTSAVKAPDALNRKRLRNGFAPVSSHTIVDLARRHRSSGLRGRSSDGETVRLHFRRGHWRQIEDRKTWVKWHLVGNPDLGFIDHHYRL